MADLQGTATTGGVPLGPANLRNLEQLSSGASAVLGAASAHRSLAGHCSSSSCKDHWSSAYLASR